uniref:AP2 domain/AP2-coincident C-terminal, putative n=1 Tax=Theileria annulata TaxID=5874 RepID=A0A3B0MI94_THEAN
MKATKFGFFDENTVNTETITKERYKAYDASDPDFTVAEAVRPKRRGRQRLNPYGYNRLGYYTRGVNIEKARDLSQIYKEPNDLEENFRNFKQVYEESDYKVNEENNLDDKDRDNLKDKNDTDTRLTSSSEVLSNFNYETIDNYEVSDNHETIDNYTASDDYITSLNDNCEFPLKTNDSTFNTEESTLKDLEKEEFPFDKEQLLEKEKELEGVTKEQLVEETNELLKKAQKTSFEEQNQTPDNLQINEQVLEKEKKISEPENVYVISEELRQSYIRQSKLLPKIRGVWFNSTVRRMGWVGQAYKKCKRIEKIFSINKHGFEGARKLAIAFRNSQKPTNKSDLPNYPDISLKDVIKPISQLRINLQQQINQNNSKEAKNVIVNERVQTSSSTKDKLDYVPTKHKDDVVRLETRSSKMNLKGLYANEIEVDDYEYPVDYYELIDHYKSQLNNEEKQVRDNICKEALLFMLYELEALVELDIPIPPISKSECKRGINFHINFLENSKKSVEVLPYINSLAHYICKGITPTDMTHFELYSLIHTLSHCIPLKMEFSST